uniref:BTB POZ domain containing protein n=1 Tax=Marseillevirus sp. TaxID=2809551 RepID=A0AA96EN48_9VIRU|nr:BTB POZ domain containing protein [Marseillevirus sp.]
MEEITLNARDGSFSVSKEELIEKSPYFKALFCGGFGDSEKKEFDVDMSLKRAVKVFQHALSPQETLPKKYRKELEFWFPGVSPHYIKNRLCMTNDVLDKFFGIREEIRVGTPIQLNQKTFSKGFLVAEAKEKETSFKDFLWGLGPIKLYRAKSDSEFTEFSTDGFWLWCQLCMEGKEKIGQKVLEETGLFVVEIDAIVSLVFYLSPRLSFWVRFGAERKDCRLFLLPSELQTKRLYRFKKGEGEPLEKAMTLLLGGKTGKGFVTCIGSEEEVHAMRQRERTGADVKDYFFFERLNSEQV